MLNNSSSTTNKCEHAINKKNYEDGSKLSNDLSKINYWKGPRSNGSDFEEYSLPSPSYVSENISHVLYDGLTDEFLGIEKFNADLHWTNVHIAGTWGSHAYEYNGWENADRPVIKMTDYQDLQLTEDELNGVLSDRIIATCSSYLERSPETGEYAMCKCVLSEKNLFEISALKYFHYLQYLDVSKNRITTLEALGELPFLMHLDASFNLLTEVLDFKPPFNLTFANFSYNDIKTIKDLSDFWSLMVLDLSHNDIKVISGLQKLRYLRGLNLSYNWISHLEGLNHLERVQSLNLYSNVIVTFEIGPNIGLKTMTKLKTLSLAKNLLNSLQIIEQARFLEVLDVSDNSIEDLVQLVYFKDLTRLNDLDMRDNPIRYNPKYFDTCVNYTKHILVLDGEELTAEMRVLSRKKFEKTIYEYVKSGTQHILLNYVNFPFIMKSVIPYTDPPRPLIVLVGPPSCLKGLLLDIFCEIYPQYVTRGVSHTTRPRSEGEIDGEQYRFVTYETFKDMMRRGLFYVTSEYFGHLYGFALPEIINTNTTKSVLILHCDLNGALLLRARGLRPTLVLTVPKSELMHRRYLRRKYFCHSLQTGILEVGLTSNKTYDGLIRLKKYTHRNIVNAIKTMLAEVFKNACHESPSLGEVQHPDAQISLGLTVRKLLHGNEDLNNLSASKSETSQKSDSGCWFMKLRGSQEETFVCLHGKNKEQCEALRSIGIDKLVQEYFSNNEENSGGLENEPTSSSGNEGNPEENAPEIEELSQLKRHFDEIIASRKTYMELHWANPGLFSQVVFTDEMDRALDVLREVLKTCVQTYHLRSPTCKMKHQPKEHPLVQKRLHILQSMMGTDGIVVNERNNCHQDQLGFQNVEGKSYSKE